MPITIAGSKTFTHDLSAGGFSAELRAALPVGSSVSGSLEVGDAKYDFTGQVAWAQAGDPRILMRAKVGVRFTGLPNDFYTRCAELLKG